MDLAAFRERRQCGPGFRPTSQIIHELAQLREMFHAAARHAASAGRIHVRLLLRLGELAHGMFLFELYDCGYTCYLQGKGGRLVAFDQWTQERDANLLVIAPAAAWPEEVEYSMSFT